MVATVVVLGVLAGGAYVADGVVRDRTEADLAEGLRAQVPGLDETPDVTIGGFPFLTQALAGELDDVRITASSVTLEGLPLHDVVVLLRDVSTDQPTTAAEATMTASARLDDLTSLLSVDADLAVEGQHLVASTTVLGMPVAITIAPRAAGRAIEADVVSFSLGGVQVDADDLPARLVEQVQGLSVPVDGLPEGMELTGLALTPDGVDLEASGTDVVLEVPTG